MVTQGDVCWAVYGYDFVPHRDARLLGAHISNLRAKLGAQADLVTVRGYGWRLVALDAARAERLIVDERPTLEEQSRWMAAAFENVRAGRERAAS